MLNLKTSVYLYQKFLDYLNIIYTIASIISLSFKNINFLISPKIGGISNIEKIIIFVDSIEKSKTLVIYLQTFLLDKLKDKGKDIIKSFALILKIITNINWLDKFFTGNTEVII